MGRILAIARNTIAQGLRMKVPLILIAFLLIVIPVLPLLLKSDGTAKGQVQLILTYSLNTASFLLCLLAVFLSVSTLRNDFKGKQIYVVDTTRAGRWEVLVGKWLGVVLLIAVLLAAMGTAVYVIVKTVVKPADNQEARVLNQEVFTARARVKPERPNTNALARQYLERFKAEGRIPPDVTEKTALVQLRMFAERYHNTVLTRFPRKWEFKGLPLPKGPDEIMTVRYKLSAANKPPDGTVRCVWRFKNSVSDEEFTVTTKQQAGSLHEFKVPAAAVGGDGTLNVIFVCYENTSVVFDREKGLEILYRAGSFEVNFLKCLGFILLKIGFLAAVGLAAGTFLTFPVASLAALFVFFISFVSGTAAGIIGLKGLAYGLSPAETDGLNYIFRWLWRTVFLIIPDFSRHSGINHVTLGEAISAWSLAGSVLFVAVLRGGILMCLGGLILSRGELARVEE